MSSADVPDPGAGRRASAFWLPPNGFGNGVDADAWAEIADLTGAQVPLVLDALAAAGIGGYVAAVHRSRRGTYRLWVDSMRYLSAEDVLMTVLRAAR